MRTETTGLELGNRYSTDTTWKKMGIPESELEVARTQSGEQPQETDIVYRVYKRRWFGLGVLALLNIVISWGVGYLFSAGKQLGLRENTDV